MARVLQKTIKEIPDLAQDANELSTASGDAPSYAARAWVNFRGSPLSGTYSRTGNLVTVTITAHGLSDGMIANLDFTTGTATDGNYPVTVTGVNTFTVVDSASGATSGNVTMNLYIRASGNVSSIADNGIGDYTINFVTAMPDTNYCTSFGINRGSANLMSVAQEYAVGGVLSGKTASSIRMVTHTVTAGPNFNTQDHESVQFIAFR
jgi:hypothetical protein